MRRRIIKPNTRSFTGRHVRPNGERPVRFESGLERDFLTLLSFRRDVRDVVEQPASFAYVDAMGKRRTYTPDFRVRYSDRTTYYEVKYKDQLAAQWPLFRQITRFMRRHLREVEGASFRIVTEKLIRTARFENIRLLAPHRASEPDPDAASRITSRLAELGPVTIAALITAIGPQDRGALYASLWALLARREVSVDLDQPLGMQSLVWWRP